MLDEAEREAVDRVLQGSILVHGPLAKEFEKAYADYTGAPFCVSVSSCTAGMHLLYFALGLGDGDEVIVPAQTHLATAHAVELTGAKAVFVDAELSSGNIDIKKIESAITKNTKALAVVHYLGVPVDMSQIMPIAKKYGLFVVEDCALSPGAKLDGIHTGLHGDAGVFSFYPVKHLTTAEGGMITLKDEKLADRLNLLKAFGVDRNHTERAIPGIYDAPELGFNYRMSELHAALGIEQIKKLPDFLHQRKENFEALSSQLHDVGGLTVLPQPNDERFESSHYCLSILLDESIQAHRPTIMKQLSDIEIGSSIYYPHPVPRISYYRNKYGYDQRQFKNAASISDRTIALPVGPHLNTEDMLFIGDSLTKIIRKLK
jgi:dTDP-4-amino-4,6-dideoxygalactose transaminase